MYLEGQKMECEAELRFASEEGSKVVEEKTRLTVQSVIAENDGELVIIFKEYWRYKFPLMDYFKPINDLTEEEIKNFFTEEQKNAHRK